MHKEGEDLNYANIAQNEVALLRAATRYFGSWRAAVDFSGLSYENVRKYKTWSRERILDRIGVAAWGGLGSVISGGGVQPKRA